MNNKYCYIHIPFCESKCKYCRFASIGNIQKLQIKKYVKHLCNEIELSRFDNSISLHSVYFGGGTPSTLNNNQFTSIFSSLKKKYNFDKNIEISLESTPQNITEANLLSWVSLGVNRVSIGVQSLNNKTLKEIGRKDNQEIINAFNTINNFLENKSDKLIVSVDFIIGLPYVERRGVLDDIKFIFDKYNFINHISIYMLEDYYVETDEIGSKYEKVTYPNNWTQLGISESDYLGEYLEIKKYLETKEIYSYEISNFSKKTKECRHNQAYWNHSDVIAYGLGANGFIDNIRYRNSESFKDYYLGKNIQKEELTKQDYFLEKVMFGLRSGGLEKDVYSLLNQERIKYFLKKNLLKKLSGKIILTNDGIALLDYIIGEIV